MQDKINKSAYSFFLVMGFILSKIRFSVADIINYLDKNNIFMTDEAVLKYIRTMKAIGFSFVRENNKIYKINNLPFEVEFSAFDKQFLLNIAEIVNKNAHLFKTVDTKSLHDKLSIFFPESLRLEYVPMVQEIYKRRLQIYELYKNIEQYCLDRQRLSVKYIAENGIIEKRIIEPDSIICDKYLQGYDVKEKTNTLISINKMLSVGQLPTKNKNSFQKQCVTLKFLSKFAKSYTLKDGEEILFKEDFELVVKSFYYNKTVFFKNILRYMENCEIVEPLPLRKEFSEYVENLYHTYDCSN